MNAALAAIDSDSARAAVGSRRGAFIAPCATEWLPAVGFAGKRVAFSVDAVVWEPRHAGDSGRYESAPPWGSAVGLGGLAFRGNGAAFSVGAGESSEDSTKSSGDSAESSEDSTKSSEDSVESSEDSTKSSGDSAESSEDSTKSSGDSVESSEDSTKSSGDSAESMRDSAGFGVVFGAWGLEGCAFLPGWGGFAPAASDFLPEHHKNE